MALPDKTPPTDKVLEYICVGCWSSFSVEGAGDSQGLVVCPSCGQAQPTVDEVLAMPGAAPSPGATASAPPPPEPEAPDEEGDVVELGADVVVEEEEAAAPEAEAAALASAIPVDLALDGPPVAAEPSPDIPVSDEAGELPLDGPAGVPLGAPVDLDDRRQAWETSNPDTVTWKMKTSGGITFNFHGIGALMSWAASKKNLGRATLTLDGREEWTDYAEFSVLYRKLGDPVAALRLVGQPVSVAPEPDADIFANESLTSTLEQAEAVADAAALQQELAEERLASTDSGLTKAPRTGQGRPGPSARATADFTFITKVQPKGAGGRVGTFLLGFLLGAAAILVLWYVGVLNMLPIHPM